LCELIKENGSTGSKKSTSLLMNFGGASTISSWVEEQVCGIANNVYKLNRKTIHRKFKENFFLQITPVHPESSSDDHQYDLHLDTFFPALKWWYFPHKVKSDEGAFQYLHNSPAPSRSLFKLFEKSLKLTQDAIITNRYLWRATNKEA